MTPTVAWSILIGLSLLWVAIGIWLGRKTKDLESYALCGRNVGLAFGAATAVATWITSNTTLLAPQFAIQLGIWGMIAYSSASFGLFLFAPLAKRIQKLMPHGFTSGDFIRIRYGRAVWVLFMLISVFYALTWLISMGMAGGLLLKAVANIPYFTGMTIILSTCVLYTLFGGMKAVIGTDFIQSLIILIGVFAIGLVLIERFELESIYQDISENKPALLWVLLPASVMAIFNNLMFGIGEIFHSNVWWSRAFAIRKGLGQWAYGLAGLFWIPVPIAAGFIALSSGVLGVNVTSPDMVGPLVSVAMLGKAGAILIFIIVFCSLASSIDSLLAATSDLIANDIYRKSLKPAATDVEVRKAMSISIVLLGIISWTICSVNKSNLAELLFFAGPLVGSTIWPILAGLYWKRATARGAMIGMLSGSIVGLLAYFQIGWFVASLIGTVMSMIATVTVTAVSKTEFNWQRLNESQVTGE